MLNELIELSRSLNKHGIEIYPVHADIKAVRKASFMRVMLSESGVDSIEFLDANSIGGMATWTLRDGQQNSFPAISLKLKGVCPLHLESVLPCELTAAAVGFALEGGKLNKIELEKQVDALAKLSAMELSEDRCKKAVPYLGRIAERAKQLTPLLSTESDVVAISFRRFVDQARSPDKLFKSLYQAITRQLPLLNESQIKLASGLVVDGTAQLYFDVIESRKKQPVGHASHKKALANLLNEATGSLAKTGICMVSGVAETLHSGKFPQLNLPYLGQTYLYSRNSVTPTTKRYGKTDVSISADAVCRLGGSLDWVFAGGEGVRWTPIPGEQGGKTDLLLVYSQSSPELPLASLFADSDFNLGTESNFDDFAESSDTTPTAFDEKSRVVIEALTRQKTSTGFVPEVNLTILRQVDPANRTAIYSSSYTAKEIVVSAEQWRNAFALRQLPSLRIVLPGKKKGDKARRIPLRSFPPLRLVDLSRRQYIRGGTERVEIVGFNAPIVLGIFTGESLSTAAELVLDRLNRQLSALIIGYGAAVRFGLAERQKFDSFTVLNGLSALHLLLFKLGRPGEIYMSEIAYKLGQFLSGCDELHAGYCVDQRGGQIPPKLIGNALVSTAGSNPLQAMEILHRRLPVYYAWADKARREGRPLPQDAKTEKAKSDAYTVRDGYFSPLNLRDLAKEIYEGIARAKSNERFRAELMLGYVAGLDRYSKTISDHDSAT